MTSQLSQIWLTLSDSEIKLLLAGDGVSMSAPREVVRRAMKLLDLESAEADRQRQKFWRWKNQTRKSA